MKWHLLGSGSDLYALLRKIQNYFYNDQLTLKVNQDGTWDIMRKANEPFSYIENHRVILANGRYRFETFIRS